MRTRKPMRWLAGTVIGVLALLIQTSAFAQLSCTSKTTSGGGGNFIVNVTQESQNGRTTYTYSFQNAPGKNGNPNKFFLYVKQGLNLEVPAPALDCLNGCADPVYLATGSNTGGFPPDAWKNVRHLDGVGANNIAISRQYSITANDRFRPEESITTILLGLGSTYESCGPIFGPTNPLVPTIEGSPLQQITAELTMANGCKYIATANTTDNIITNLTTHPDTPFASSEPPHNGEACTVETEDCATALGLVFCPPVKLGSHFLQSTVGGTCYAPRNIKFPC